MEKKRNLWVIPTDKPSRLHLGNSGLVLCDLRFNSNSINGQHIYITSDEDIKDRNCWVTNGVEIFKPEDLSEYSLEYANRYWQTIILTTDQDLDGVQAIDNEFLEWFVKNPSCENVEVDKNWNYPLDKSWEYKIIIPKEEPKPWYNENETDKRMNIIGQNGNEGYHYEETELDEVGAIAAGLCEHLDAKEQAMFIAGFQECIKWQAKRMYSAEDMREAFIAGGNSQIEEEDDCGFLTGILCNDPIINDFEESSPTWITTPQQSEVQKWLWKEHKLWVEVTLWGDGIGFVCAIKQAKGKEDDGSTIVRQLELVNVGLACGEPTKALEKGLLRALKLIEL